MIEFKRYLHGVSDAGSRLMFKFRSGTHGLNEELGRHRGREGAKECVLCDADCESVSHVLWECPAYSIVRRDFLFRLGEGATPRRGVWRRSRPLLLQTVSAATVPDPSISEIGVAALFAGGAQS